jgi:proline dehydrogenase
MTEHDDLVPHGGPSARIPRSPQEALSPREALSLPATRSPLRAAITAAYRRPEPEAVPPLVAAARLPAPTAAAAQALARRLAQTLRDRKSAAGREGLVQGLLQEYSLSSQEGVALMCLAEALLRIPDPATRDALIRDKIGTGQWHEHLGRSPSLFVNAATWGLLLTGKLVSTHSESGLSSALARLVGKGGEPLIRKSVDRAMRLMGEQFVTGETIAEALANARPREAQGFRYSYDMLGEAALTAEDAARYRRAYEDAIDAIGRASAGRGIHAGPGISIKLSALHPRYSRAQIERVGSELYPVLRDLALRSRRHDVGLNVDAEEADRLEISLDLLERLCFEPELAGWNGIGFVVQAYQKRCPFVIDALVDLARRSGHRLMVRLVKGAYWDSEIKRAQVDGLDGYPVYTGRPTPTSPTSRARAACSPRPTRCSRSSRPTTRTRWRDPRARRRHRRASRSVRVPVPARHGRAALRAGRRPARRRQARTAVPHLRAGRHPRDAARLPRATPARERRQHLVRQPHRRRVGADRRAGRGSGDDGRADRPAEAGAAPGAIGRPHPRSRCRRRSTVRRGATRAASTS